MRFNIKIRSRGRFYKRLLAVIYTRAVAVVCARLLCLLCMDACMRVFVYVRMYVCVCMVMLWLLMSPSAPSSSGQRAVAWKQRRKQQREPRNLYRPHISEGTPSVCMCVSMYGMYTLCVQNLFFCRSRARNPSLAGRCTKTRLWPEKPGFGLERPVEPLPQ